MPVSNQATPQQAQGGKMTPQQINQMQSSILRRKALPRLNLLQSFTLTPSSQNILTFQPNYVGLLRRFWIEVIGTLTNAATNTATLTDVGLPNMISNVILTDTSNYQRINTTGTHLYLLSSLKRRHPLGATAAWNNVATNNLSQQEYVPPATWPVYTAVQSLSANSASTCRAVFEIPACYSDDDLRGAIFLNLNNATMGVTLTFNQNVFVASGTDTTNAVYSGNTGTFTSVTVNVYQDYLDQLPVDSSGNYILPTLDLSTAYLLNNTTLSPLTANNDYPVPFLNFRDFHSVIAYYNNNGTTRAYGTDINYLELLSANITPIYKMSPLMNTFRTRNLLGADLPAGFYYMDFRKKPLSTLAYGNMQFVLNPITASAGNYLGMLWEATGNLQTIAAGGSLPAGG
jgi:hypothetical protein